MLVGEGLRSKDIARRLGISPRTVDAHIASAVSTLEARSRLDAVLLLSRADPLVVLPTHPAGLAAGDLQTATTTPDREGAITWWRRVPILRNGGLRNDLTALQRLAWMFFGAIAIIFAFSQLANGLSVAQKIAIGLNR